MTSTDAYAAAAAQSRRATERSVEVFKRGAESVTDPAGLVATLPTVDLTQPVERYFDYLQKSLELQRDLATRWVELVNSVTNSFRDQVARYGDLMTHQADTVAELTSRQADVAVDRAREQAERVEQAEREHAREAKRVEREQARKAAERARAKYQDLTKVELAERLGDRGLPKTGTVDELVDRLVSADTE